MQHPRDSILQTMERIYRYRMTTTSGGNLSIRDPDGSIWITPARIDKGGLRREDVVRVMPDGTSIGLHPPSSEFPFHKAIYDVRPDIQSIVHAHPVALVAFSICGSLPDTRIFHQSYFMAGKVGFAPYALPGSQALGSSIAQAFGAGSDSVILENHGVVVGGHSLDHAFQRFEAFEFSARTIIQGSFLGQVRYLDEDSLRLAYERSLQLVPVDFPDTSSEEKELRKQLVDFLRRGCRQRLLISTEGSYSARIKGNEFLITPSQKDRERLDAEELVRVSGNQHESGKSPSRATMLHADIYSRHPEVQSIVFAHPVNATAFSITDSPLNARTIPESYLFLREVNRIPYGTQYGRGEKSISQYVSLRRPAAIVENDGVVVLGTGILDAFDRLEVLESTAEAIINAQRIGSVVAMNESVISELRHAFKMVDD